MSSRSAETLALAANRLSTDGLPAAAGRVITGKTGSRDAAARANCSPAIVWRLPSPLLTRYRLAITFALAGDMMFFVALVSSFFVRQASGHIDASNNYISDWHPLSAPPILWLNTAILLLSSVTIEAARRQLFREIDVMEEWFGLGKPTVRRATPWLAATVGLGMLFVTGQWIAWRQLYSQGLYYTTNPNSNFYYLVTGAHALHLVIGMLAIAFAIVGLFLLKRIEYRQIAVDCTAWYWHTMGVFWIFLFLLLAFFQ
jgi:cytochrome c oxidase subunit 3